MKTLLKNIIPQTGLFTMTLILISAIYNIVGNSEAKLLFVKLLILIDLLRREVTMVIDYRHFFSIRVEKRSCRFGIQ